MSTILKMDLNAFKETFNFALNIRQRILARNAYLNITWRINNVKSISLYNFVGFIIRIFLIPVKYVMRTTSSLNSPTIVNKKRK